MIVSLEGRDRPPTDSRYDIFRVPDRGIVVMGLKGTRANAFVARAIEGDGFLVGVWTPGGRLMGETTIASPVEAAKHARRLLRRLASN